jgi:hypothetical protein
MRGQGRADCDHLCLSHRSAPERCRIPAKRRLGCNSRKNDKPTGFCTLKSAKPSRFTHQLAVRSCPGGRSSGGLPGAGAFFRGAGGANCPLFHLPNGTSICLLQVSVPRSTTSVRRGIGKSRRFTRIDESQALRPPRNAPGTPRKPPESHAKRPETPHLKTWGEQQTRIALPCCGVKCHAAHR